MRAGGKVRVALVTCGTLKEARGIARSVTGKRLAACVNVILSPVESFYTWKGKQEFAREYLLVMKTTAARLGKLEREVKRAHSYEVAEFIALPVAGGSKEYLGWLLESVR